MPNHIKQNAKLYALVYAYCVVVYFILNKGALFAPRTLPLTVLDHVPLISWTSIIYLTVYPFPLLAILYVTDPAMIKRMMFTFFGASNVAFVFFVFFPVTIVRPEFEAFRLIDLPLKFIYVLDQPINCFPSLHVTYAFLTAFFVADARRDLAWRVLVWAIIISISTLTVKQHYAWDVIAGYFLARLGHLVQARLAKAP
ncbi:MAG: phosphatase PAP2 family protein [Oligoflexia bacterium]|nr:phosphatase PAP2 family protein [Oligoflexia bacterium]